MFDKLKSKTIIMNLFDNMHGLKGCIRCLTFKNVLLAHFLLAFSVAGSVSAEALPTRSEERRVGEEGRSRWSPYH